MKARSVARELALLALFQLEKKGGKVQLEKTSLQELVVNTVRTLVSLSQEQIEAVADEVGQIRDYLVDYEIQHPHNENVPLDKPTEPVPIPTTQEMVQKLDNLMQAVHNLEEAIFLPEVNALSEREDVQNYCYMLVRNVLKHQEEIDRRIDEASEGWRVDRIQKMDLTLMRLAIAEIFYADNVEPATVINEVLELANQFTNEEGRKFVHGVLSQITGTPVGVTE